MWTAQHFPFLHPRQLITSGGLGTMGFGLGAAMGAAASDPGGQAGGAGHGRQLVPHESDRAFHHRVLRHSGDRRHLQQRHSWAWCASGRRCSSATATARRRSTAGRILGSWRRPTGSPARAVNAVETFAAAFKAAVEKREPCIIECMLDIDEMVAPMVAPARRSTRSA